MNIAQRALLSSLAVATVSTSVSAQTRNIEERRALMISAQVVRKEGKLLRSRDLLASCAETACEETATECGEIFAFCRAKLTEVEAEVPTVSVRVKDDRGYGLIAERVEIDGVGVDASKVLDLDPGTHAVKAAYAGRSAESSFTLARGEKNATVSVAIDLREPVVRRPIPAPVWVLGATTIVSGLLALGTGIYTVHQYQGLDGCQPYCDSSQRNTLRTTGYVSDVSTIIALASAVAGVIWFLARPTKTEIRWLRTTTTTEGGAR